MHAKANGKPPITRHPLFPATVALWFGALFGLGSLAIRPTLLESLIVSLNVDAVIASAAPPIGATTRILLALTMSGLGGLLGAMLARRIGRPKPVVRERKRKAGQSAEQHTAQEALSFARRAETVTAAQGKRTSLAMAEEPVARVADLEKAPVPGGAPLILDVSEFDLEGFQTEGAEDAGASSGEATAEAEFYTDHRQSQEMPACTPPAAEPAVPENAQVFIAAPEPAEQGAELAPAAPYGLPEELESQEPDSAGLPADHFHGIEHGPMAPPADRREAEPIPAAFEPEPFPGTHEQGAHDHAATTLGTPPFAAPDAPAGYAPAPSAPPFAAPGFMEGTPAEATGSADYEREAEELPRLADEQGLGTATAAPHEPSHAEPGASRPASPDAEPAPGLFTQPLSARVSKISWPQSLGSHDAGEASARAPSPGSEPVPANEAQDPAQGDETPGFEVKTPPVHQAQPDSAAERIASAELDDLSQIELLERLAIAMRRKHGTETADADMPRQSAAIPASEPAPMQAAPFAPPQAPAAPAAEGMPSAPFAQPASASPPSPVVPAALRPIGLDPEEEDDFVPAHIPPRHIGTQGLDSAAFAAPPSAEPPEPDEESKLAEGYSSLLGLSRREANEQRFVRIEEPESFNGEIEPAVVFPGHESKPAAPFAEPAAPAAQASDLPVAAAPFARPTEAVDGQAANRPLDTGQRPSGAAPDKPPFARRPDSDETERTLRSALATLQRMSGAA